VVTGLLVFFVVAIAVQRLVELRLAGRNAELALARGAVEHGAAHYPLFFVLHGGWLIAFPIEALLRGPSLDPRAVSFVMLFLVAFALRIAAIRTLGARWNTRVLVVPGDPPIERGPYFFLAHPNYVAVALELASVPLIFGAYRTAIVASLLNLLLLACVRIPVENRALRADRGR
jgi:methyltransferase